MNVRAAEGVAGLVLAVCGAGSAGVGWRHPREAAEQGDSSGGIAGAGRPSCRPRLGRNASGQDRWALP
ncbi:hypothetical protein [Saccharopolyspora sp. SCSIO 74807]|uniref:hypothetical protein n=1 Tax=Saccharopolyspora sp. SCSIO 74807 TaxID=3118084 RepID=UPI0030D12C40